MMNNVCVGKIPLENSRDLGTGDLEILGEILPGESLRRGRIPQLKKEKETHHPVDLAWPAFFCTVFFPQAWDLGARQPEQGRRDHCPDWLKLGIQYY